MADRSDNDIIHYGDHTFAAGSSLDLSAIGGVAHYTRRITFANLGSGASYLAPATGFPLRTRILDAWLEVDTAAAGEADLAATIGVTADPDGYKTTQNLNAVAAGTLQATNAALAMGLYYADAATSGLGVTFTATEQIGRAHV